MDISSSTYVQQYKKLIPINYVLIGDPAHEGRATIYHLLDRTIVYHLRFLMTLMLLPFDTSSLDTEQPIFSAALHRLTIPPSILRVPAEGKFEDWQWSFLKDQPLVVLAVNGKIPRWGAELARFKPVGLLTPSERVLKRADEEGCFHTGLLKGFSDLENSYHVLEGLIKTCIKEFETTSEISKIFSKLDQQELYKDRSRLRFMPPISLPEPNQGRSAAYLLNRLSNNVEKNSLLPPGGAGFQNGFLVFPRILDYSYAASLYYLELN